MLCAGSERTESIARQWRSTTAIRPPNASATISREPSGSTAISRGANGISSPPAIDSDGPESSGARGNRLTNVSRRGQVEETTADSPPAVTTTRTGSGATAARPMTLGERSRSSIRINSPAARSTARRCRPSGSTARSASPRPTSCSAATRRAAVSMTERLPLRRLAASSVLPPSTIASATGWRSRRAGEWAGPGSSARTRAGQVSRSAARPAAARAGMMRVVLITGSGPCGGPAWQHRGSGRRRSRVSRPACRASRLSGPARAGSGSDRGTDRSRVEAAGAERMIGLDPARGLLGLGGMPSIARPISARGRPSPRSRQPVTIATDHRPSPTGIVDLTVASYSDGPSPSSSIGNPPTGIIRWAPAVVEPTTVARWLSWRAAASHSAVPAVEWSTSTAIGQPRNRASGSAGRTSRRAWSRRVRSRRTPVGCRPRGRPGGPTRRAPRPAEVEHQRAKAFALHPPRQLAELVRRAGRDVGDLDVADGIGSVEADLPIGRAAARRGPRPSGSAAVP